MKAQKNILSVLSVILLFSITACKNKKAEQEKLQTEVMNVHDELMGKMESIMNNKSALSLIENRLDSLKIVDASLDTAKLRLDIEKSKVTLTSSDDAMMKWMNDFNPDYSGKSEDQILDYLNKEKAKISVIKNKINQSLSNSDSLIIKYK